MKIRKKTARFILFWAGRAQTVSKQYLFTIYAFPVMRIRNNWGGNLGLCFNVIAVIFCYWLTSIDYLWGNWERTMMTFSVFSQSQIPNGGCSKENWKLSWSNYNDSAVASTVQSVTAAPMKSTTVNKLFVNVRSSISTPAWKPFRFCNLFTRQTL